MYLCTSIQYSIEVVLILFLVHNINQWRKQNCLDEAWAKKFFPEFYTGNFILEVILECCDIDSVFKKKSLNEMMGFSQFTLSPPKTRSS